MVHVVMRLIPKPTGGERAVGIFGSYIRVVLRAVRHSFGAMWMRRSIGHQWFGVEGRSVERAVWTRLTVAGYARARGQSSAAVLYDIQKAYPRVPHGGVMTSLEIAGVPARILVVVIVATAAAAAMIMMQAVVIVAPVTVVALAAIAVATISIATVAIATVAIATVAIANVAISIVGIVL